MADLGPHGTPQYLFQKKIHQSKCYETESYAFLTIKTQIALLALSACCFKLIIRKILAVKCCEANFWFSTHQVHFLTFFAQINLALVESEEKIKTTKCNF